MKGLAGSSVTLDEGSTVMADDAYLERAILDPDAQIPEGFEAGIMSGAVASQKFDKPPDDVAALVAFVKGQGLTPGYAAASASSPSRTRSPSTRPRRAAYANG